MTSLKDCISVEHLGRFLEMIACSPGQSQKFSNGIYTGKPNLILCPKYSIWKTILSLYVTSFPDLDETTSAANETCLPQTKSLPSAAEVLVCSKSTTLEDMELLFRRAIQNPGDNG